MDFTLTPRSPRTTIVLSIVLVASLVWIQSMDRKDGRSGGARAESTAAAGAGFLPEAVAGGSPAAPRVPATTPAGSWSARGAAPLAAGADTLFLRNPFLHLPAESSGDGGVAPNKPPNAFPPPRLQGTVIAERRAMALISGRYYATGEQVLGWRIISIDPREVRIRQNGETLTLRTGR